MRIDGADDGVAGRMPKTLEAYLTSPHLDALDGLLPQEAAALQALQAAAAAAAPPVLTGVQLFEQLEALQLLHTGCLSIDQDLLRGGMRPGQMVEVCGESASGKTQLCMAAAALAASQRQRVVYVDTSNALRAARLQGVVEAQAAAEGAQQAVAADPLKFVEVRRCYDVHSLLGVLDELMAQQAQQARQAQQAEQQEQQQGQLPQQQEQQQQQQQQAEQQQDVQQPAAAGPQQAPPSAAAPSGAGRRPQLGDLPVSLLIVDCLSAVITPILGGGAGQHSQGHALLAAVATSLKALMNGPQQPAVLVTNHMVGGSGERRHEKRPAMGESWRNQPHVRIILRRPPPGSTSEECTAALAASSVSPQGLRVTYVKTKAGLAAAGDAAAWAGPAPMNMHA